MNQPTPEDLARDLAEDLRSLEGSGWLEHRGPWVRCSLAWAAALRRALAAEAEVLRLRRLIEGLAGRVAAQSELLSRRAEEGGPP